MTTFITILFIIVLLGGTLAAIMLTLGICRLLKEVRDKRIMGSHLLSVIILLAIILIPIMFGVLGAMAYQIIGWGVLGG